MQDDFDALLPMGTKETKASQSINVAAIFKKYSLGISTNRDDVVYAWTNERLAQRVAKEY